MARVRKTAAAQTQPQLPFDATTAAKIDAKLAVIGQGVAKRRPGRPPRVTRPGDVAPLTQEQKMAYWNDLMMGVPNDLVRCALFTATDCDEMRSLSRERIASHAGTTVMYTGWQLTQAHLDVFEGILQLMRGQEAGVRVNFSKNELLEIIGRRNSGYEYEWVHRKIIQLEACAVEIIKNRRKGFFGSLIEKGKFDEFEGTYSVIVSEELINLFDEGFSKVQWGQRKALMGKPLACWLQMYYCSHKNPFPVTVSFLKTQCGSKTAEIKHFKPNLTKALDQIVEVGVIDGWEIAKDGVVTVKKPIVSRKKAA